MNVNYFIRLSFDKLETFDVNRTSLSNFVLVRNSLISALTEQKNQDYYDQDMDDIILEEDDDDYNYDDDEEEMDILKQQAEEEEEQAEKGKDWLDSCFDQLEQDEEELNEDSDDDEVMPLSPQQQDDNDDFYSKRAVVYNQALVDFDLPFLSFD